MDYGKIAIAGVAGATGTYFFGRLAAFGGPINEAAGGILGTVAYDAIVKLYEGHVMTPGEFANDATMSLVVDAVLAKGAQVLGAKTESLWAPLKVELPPGGSSSRKINWFEGNTNCANCAIALDATLAGNPASALNGPARSMSYLASAIGKTVRNWIPANGIKGVTTMMKEYGAGSRGIVYAWKEGQPLGHYFNVVVNQRGQVKYLDARRVE